MNSSTDKIAFAYSNSKVTDSYISAKKVPSLRYVIFYRKLCLYILSSCIVWFPLSQTLIIYLQFWDFVIFEGAAMIQLSNGSSQIQKHGFGKSINHIEYTICHICSRPISCKVWALSSSTVYTFRQERYLFDLDIQLSFIYPLPKFPFSYFLKLLLIPLGVLKTQRAFAMVASRTTGDNV